MILVRAWRRELLGGMGVVLIVPATLVVALALLALAGGFTGLGALGQAFSGPPLPVGSVAHGANRPVRAIPAAALTALANAPGAGARGRPLGAGSRPARRGSRTPLRTSPIRVTSGPAPTATPSPSAPTAPAPASHPTVTDEVVGAAGAATSQLPPPAAQTVTSTLDAVGSAIDQVAPIPAPTAPSLP
jgi:hypothetical protein